MVVFQWPWGWPPPPARHAGLYRSAGPYSCAPRSPLVLGPMAHEMARHRERPGVRRQFRLLPAAKFIGRGGAALTPALQQLHDEADAHIKLSGRRVARRARINDANNPRAKVFRTRISQIEYQFDDLLGCFCYKNQCSTIITTGYPRVPRRVNPKKPIYGSISTVD